MNWETRCIHVETQNDSNSQWVQIAEEVLEGEDGDAEDATLALAKRMKDDYIEQLDELKSETNMRLAFSDVLSGALGEIDWMEIADGFIEEAAEKYED